MTYLNRERTTMRNDYLDYLVHSSGPWKVHKYVKKIGNKYIYPKDAIRMPNKYSDDKGDPRVQEAVNRGIQRENFEKEQEEDWERISKNKKNQRKKQFKKIRKKFKSSSKKNSNKLYEVSRFARSPGMYLIERAVSGLTKKK